MASIYKTLGTKDVMKDISKMMQHFTDFNFLNFNDKKLMLSFNAENVKQNIHNEWLISNLINCNEPSFLSSSLDGKTQVISNFKSVKSVVKKLPWSIVGCNLVNKFESTIQSLDSMEVLKSFFNMKNGMIMIKTETLLEKATLIFLCDSYEGMEDTERKMLRFHRKLAPYKLGFSAVASTPADERNLKDLALLLTKQIRKVAISVLLLDDMCSAPLKEQIFRNDALGIPYTVIMDANTLKTGLLGIRSRDTTLKVTQL
ncbi:UNVERIFIED_CONTAM: hypothetical protein PYX00_000368 [Menopon gallinae]|uniref:Anticodon-binding domain-containing protein n=1 Tax=Menopon gallinae TaxID=328185 RepID=A0AAW2I9S5_9NEOP